MRAHAADFVNMFLFADLFIMLSDWRDWFGSFCEHSSHSSLQIWSVRYTRYEGDLDSVVFAAFGMAAIKDAVFFLASGLLLDQRQNKCACSHISL